jgi:hypothetical protein
VASIKSGRNLASKTEKKNYEGKKFTCNKCGKNLAIESNFFKLKNNTLCMYPIYPVCKKCLKEEYEKLRFEHGDKNGLKIILRKLDRPYLEDIVNKAIEREKNDILGYCIKTLNGLQQYASLTYDDSDFIKSKSLTTDDLGKIKSMVEDLTDEEWNRWSGYGLEPEQILECNHFYKNMMNKYEFDSLNEELSVIQLAVTNINIKKAFKEGDTNAIERLRKTISSIENDLNIQGKQKKADMDKDTFGNFIRMIENEEPIPEPKSEFKDVDGIWKLVKRYIVGYLAVAMGKAREEDVLGEDYDVLNQDDKIRRDDGNE